MKRAIFFVAFWAFVGSSVFGAGLFKMDFGTLQNDEFGLWDAEEFPGELEGWDEFPTFNLDDCDDCEMVDVGGMDAWEWSITDWGGSGDDDVKLTIFDQEELADDIGSFANGMIHNNPVPQYVDVVYDGIEVPMQVKDDYLYRDPDTAGTEMLFRFANLDPGDYNVTLFTGRPSDANGQYAKLWVEKDPLGKGEPDEENTGNFTGFDPEEGIEEPEGIPVTIPVSIAADEFLWYAHMEDNSGGISGIIIRSLGSPPATGDINGNGSLDTEDIDLLTAEVLANTNTAAMDLNGDGAVNQADRSVWVTELRNTWFGDSNLDGEFNSSDFVAVFTSGKFEQDLDASWAEGDWNGDNRFNSADFVAAFTDGGFELGPRPQAANVPEPTTYVFFVVGLIALMLRGCRSARR